MVKYFWIVFGLVALVALVQLFGFSSLELTVALFSVNFMVLALEMGRERVSRTVILTKIEGLEMVLNDITSNLISPALKRKKQEIIEWLNKF